LTAYRAYQLDPSGKIAGADWLEADSDQEAEVMALRLCGPGVPLVELWLGANRISVVACAEPAPKRRGA
jgi:hypothetical protein